MNIFDYWDPFAVNNSFISVHILSGNAHALKKFLFIAIKLKLADYSLCNDGIVKGNAKRNGFTKQGQEIQLT